MMCGNSAALRFGFSLAACSFSAHLHFLRSDVVTRSWVSPPSILAATAGFCVAMASTWPSRRTNTPGGGLRRLTGSLQTSTLPLFSPTYWYNQLASFGEADTPPMSLSSSEAGTSQGSAESAISSQLTEISEPDPSEFASSVRVSQGATGCDKPAVEVEADAPALYRFKSSTLYVARSRFVTMDTEASSLWQKDVKPRLQTDLQPVMERIRAKSCSKPLQESAVYLDLRMSGHIGKGASRKVRLFPTIWILCGSKWCKKMISGVIKELAWLSSLNLGMEIHQGPPLPAATDEFEVPGVFSVNPESFITLPNGEKLWVHVQSPGLYGSCNGLLCCCTTEKAGEYRQVLSRIGGAMTSETGVNFGTTTAHGLFSICTPVVQNVDASSGSEPDSSSDSDSISSFESDDTSIHDETFQQSTIEDQDPVLGQIHISKSTFWHNLSEMLSAHFLHGSLRPDGDGGMPIPRSDYRDDQSGTVHAPDFAFVRSEELKAFRNVIVDDTNYPDQPNHQSGSLDSATGCKLVLGPRRSLEARMIAEDVCYYLGGNEIAVQKVELSGRLGESRPQEANLIESGLISLTASGNSGSWIFNNNQFSGMILANSSIEPFALAMTAGKLYADISSACPDLGHMSVELSTISGVPSLGASSSLEITSGPGENRQKDVQVDSRPGPSTSPQPALTLGSNLADLGHSLRSSDVHIWSDSGVDVDSHATATDSIARENEKLKTKRLELEAEVIQMREEEDRWRRLHKDLSVNLKLTQDGLKEAEETHKKEIQREEELEETRRKLQREVGGLHKSITATAFENDQLLEQIAAAELEKKKGARKTKDQEQASKSAKPPQNVNTAARSSSSGVNTSRHRRRKIGTDSGYESMPAPISVFSSSSGPDMPYQYPSYPYPFASPMPGAPVVAQPQRRRSISTLRDTRVDEGGSKGDSNAFQGPPMPPAFYMPPAPYMPSPPWMGPQRPLSASRPTSTMPRPVSYYGAAPLPRRSSISNLKDVVKEVDGPQASEDARIRRVPTYSQPPPPYSYPMPPPPGMPRTSLDNDTRLRRRSSFHDVEEIVTEVGISRRTEAARGRRAPVYSEAPRVYPERVRIPPPPRKARKSVVFDGQRRNSSDSLNEMDSLQDRPLTPDLPMSESCCDNCGSKDHGFFKCPELTEGRPVYVLDLLR